MRLSVSAVSLPWPRPEARLNMSTPSADELADVLRQVREHTEFLRELGVEHLSLDSETEVVSNVSIAPANHLAGAKPAKVDQVEIPHRAASPTVVKPAESLFGQ